MNSRVPDIRCPPRPFLHLKPYIMRVQLFITCLIDSLFPEIGEAVVQVLQQAGQQIAFPSDQTCCGQPAFNAGFHGEARRMAQHTIAALSISEDPVIVPSGSCTAMMRRHYIQLFADDPVWLPRAQALAARCYELSEFLVDQLGITAWKGTRPARLAYHASCHTLRTLGVDRQPQALLASMAGPQLVSLPADCCGFGGVFAVDHAPLSSALLQRRLQQIEACGAEVVVACDVSCLMNIEGGLRKCGSQVRCAHLAQVLMGSKPGLR
jgi:L-lactate dehydrogenase complex protein LldE